MDRMRKLWFVALLLVVCAVIPSFFWATAIAQEKEKADAGNVKWEYKIIQSKLEGGGDEAFRIDREKMEQELNQAGKDGWECVGAVGEVSGGNRLKQETITRAILICKRAVK